MLRVSDYVNNSGILGIIRRCCNYVDPRLMDHGFRVARLTEQIVKHLGICTGEQLRDVCVLAMLHDIGAYKTDEVDKMIQFETMDVRAHSVYGYLFIKHFSPLEKLAPVILHHHTRWELLKDRDDISEENKLYAQIIFIADRMDVFMEVEQRSLEAFLKQLSLDAGKWFVPCLRDLFLREAFQQDIRASRQVPDTVISKAWELPFHENDIMSYLSMITYTIDFRSYYTVTHTIMTTYISQELAKHLKLSEEQIERVTLGAMLHDLGKIGIPVEILEFPGKLSPQAMGIMKTHVDVTEKILNHAVDEETELIALRHHEKLDGSGYPRGLSADALTCAQRIVAISDVVSALAGTRSYKEAYSKDKIVGIIRKMKEDGLLDGMIIDVMTDYFDEIMETVKLRCSPVLDTYCRIQEEYKTILQSQ